MAKVTSRTRGKADEVKGKAKAAVGAARGKPKDEAAGKRQSNRGKMKQAAASAKRKIRKATS